MSEVLRIVVFAMGILFVLTVFYLLITKKINERASLPWIAASVVIMALAVLPSIIIALASLFVIDYPPALLFLISNFVLFLLVLYQSIQISGLQNKCRELAQSLAIINSTGNITAYQAKIKKKTITKNLNSAASDAIDFPNSPNQINIRL